MTGDGDGYRAELTADAVGRLNFSELVALVDEPNMCSGGAATIRAILREIPGLTADDRILEVGSNTGFSVLEFASWTPCEVHGIDINARSVASAAAKARALGLPNARFAVGDGTRIDFPDGDFRLVFVSNVTSFIPDRRRAVDEYHRVMHPWGVLAAVPIYYHRPPPAGLVAEVSAAIGAPLAPWGRGDWEALFGRPGSVLFFAQDHEYEDVPAAEIDEYVDAVLNQPTNAELPVGVKDAARDRLRYYYGLFNRNLGYARFAILLYRKHEPTPFPVLHRTRAVDPSGPHA